MIGEAKMSEGREILIQRAMSWQRAKGELLALLETYWSDYPSSHPQYTDDYEQAETRIHNFIADFENHCR
jgi:hypothetical protein